MISRARRQSGNILFIILSAVLLLAALSFAITQNDRGGGNLNTEQTQIRAASVASFAIDLKRAVTNMIRAGKSENTISFAHANLTGYGTPDSNAGNEVFNIAGGGVSYTPVPDNASDGSQWEFYGNTAAPGVGDDAVPDLMLVLPNVTQAFCTAYNKKAGFDPASSIPTDSSTCVHDTANRFSGSFPTSGVNVMDAGSFPKANTPYPSACVACGAAYHAYYVLLER